MKAAPWSLARCGGRLVLVDRGKAASIASAVSYCFTGGPIVSNSTPIQPHQPTKQGLQSDKQSRKMRTPTEISPGRRRMAYQASGRWNRHPRLMGILPPHRPLSTSLLPIWQTMPCVPRKTRAETGLTHTKRLFRVKLTPCFPVVCGTLARPHAGREPKYLGYHEGKGSSSNQRMLQRDIT